MKSFTKLPVLLAVSAILAAGFFLGAYALRTQAQFGAQPIFTVPQGGTGWSAIQSPAIPYGNGTSRLSTTTAGTPGYVLSFQSGIPTWVATSTCLQLTGSAALCDGDDATSAGAANDFVFATTYGTTSAATTSPLWLRGNAKSLFASSTAYFGAGGVGSSTIQVGPDQAAWSFGYLGADDSFRISSSTGGLAVSPALTIAKSNLLTTLAGSLTVSGTNFTFGGDAFDELVGDGLDIASGDLIFDCSDVAGTGITCSGEDITAEVITAGDGLTKTALDFDCDTASGSVFGCLSSADWTTFSNKIGWGQATSTSANQFVYTNNNGLLVSAASSSLFGYTPLNPTRQLTIAGTANQLTSSAGAQDLSADRTWTLSLPNHVIFPGNFQAGNSTTTNATTTSLHVLGQVDIDGLTSALILTGAGGILAEYTGIDCTNQFVRDVDAAGAGTCATVGASDVSLANLTATDSTLTFSGTYTGATARTIGLNLGNANTWTALQQFGNATSTLFSATYASSTDQVIGRNLTFGGVTADTWPEFCATITGGAALCDGDDASGGAGGSFPFTPATTYAANSSATSTALWAQAALYASSTVAFGTGGNQFLYWNSSTNKLGIGSTSPWALMSINGNVLTNGTPQFAIGSSTKTDFLVGSNGYVGLATTSPWARFTLDRANLASGFASSSILVTEWKISTSTNKIIDARDGNQQLFQISTAATTINLTGFLPGTQLKLIVCNSAGTAGAITWATTPANLLLWTNSSTSPTQTTTANKCDVWSFLGTQATSSQISGSTPGSLGKIFGALTPNF